METACVNISLQGCIGATVNYLGLKQTTAMHKLIAYLRLSLLSCASPMESNYVCALCDLRLKTKEGYWQTWVQLDKETGKILEDSSGTWLSKRVGKTFPRWEDRSYVTFYVDKIEDAICWAYVCPVDAGSCFWKDRTCDAEDCG